MYYSVLISDFKRGLKVKHVALTRPKVSRKTRAIRFSKFISNAP